MDETVYQFYESMRVTLLHQEQLYGQLKLLSSHTEDTRSIERIIAAVRQLIHMLQRHFKFKLYNVKIFTEENRYLETSSNIPISATCYNYLLLNTNFSSQQLLRKDMRFGHIVGSWPTLSLYLFIKIIWHVKCEDLLVESLTYIPLDLCTQILKTTLEHINELEFLRARRLVLLLICKIYYKCSRLHLGIISQENVIKRISQLRIYFEDLLDFLVKPKSVTLSEEEKYHQHGILVKNILNCIKKCMQGKIKSYWPNGNVAELFTLTYGNSRYRYMLSISEVKSIMTNLDQKLLALLTNQTRYIKRYEYMIWEVTIDDEITIISLQRAIVMECHYLMEFMKQNKLFVTHKKLFLCLQRLVGSRKSEESIVTLQELCREIADGRSHDMRELIRRYKEWDLSILSFINERIELLKIYDVFVILEYLHYIYPYLQTNAEKHQAYLSIVKILIQLSVSDMHYIVQNYVERHFDDNPLEYLYDERCFLEFLERSSFIDSNEIDNFVRNQELRALLMFILLNPKEVLSEFVMHEINSDSSSYMFDDSMILLRSYYTLRYGQYNLLMYILQNVLLGPGKRLELSIRFIYFMDNVIDYQMMTADDIINELYITYLVRSYLEKDTLSTILLHTYSILGNGIYTSRTSFARLITALLKTTSLLRRCHRTFTKIDAYQPAKLISEILRKLHRLNILSMEQYSIIYSNGVEPLEVNELFGVNNLMNVLEIIQEYEKRCFNVHQQLRTNSRCHPELRDYVRSFKLDREAIIRHLMLHCFEIEYGSYFSNLTFKFFYCFGWANQMVAFENVMRISVDTLQIVLMYVELFSKDTFIMLLHVIIVFSQKMENRFNQNNKGEIRYILLKTLFSMKPVVDKTSYEVPYNCMLRYIQDNVSHPLKEYYAKLSEWLYVFFRDNDSDPLTVSLPNTCDESSYCKHPSCRIKNKITAMYNANCFISECIRLYNREINRCCERLLHSLCSRW